MENTNIPSASYKEMKLPEPKYIVSEDKHKYSIVLPTGETIGPLKSVTGALGIIAKPALIAWSAREAANYFKTEILRLGRSALDPAMLEQISKDAAQAHRKKASDAADLGSTIHNVCEAIILGCEPESIPEEIKEALLAFKKWRLSSDIQIVATEIATGSVKYKYGGRIDAVGWSKDRGGFGIIDLKTSKSLLYGNEYSLQVGGYAAAMAEQYGVDFSWAEIVRLGKAAPFTSEVRPVTDMAAAVDGFMAALTLSNGAETRIIGEPSFTTEAAVHAPEKKSAVKSKDKIAPALGF
ncbi:MAG TPA: hypothetical protein DD723_10090 [Candidatus Omnitrophica bacterium]|nr:hypothetical protein [Candidatus Omnitrophota bacterium]